MITLIGALLFISPLHYAPALEVFGSLDVHIITMIFIPPLIFDSAFSADWYLFQKQFGKIILLAVPVLGICVALTAVGMFYGLQYGFPIENGSPATLTWAQCILFGSIISATDPVSVVAMLKDLGASKRLTTTIEGESLLNDGTAMVIFLVMLEIVEGVTPQWQFILLKFVRLAIGGPIIGLIFGWILVNWLTHINRQPILEANLTVVMAYLVFFICEHEYVQTSGILALVTMGLYVSHYGKPHIES